EGENDAEIRDHSPSRSFPVAGNDTEQTREKPGAISTLQVEGFALHAALAQPVGRGNGGEPLLAEGYLESVVGALRFSIHDASLTRRLVPVAPMRKVRLIAQRGDVFPAQACEPNAGPIDAAKLGLLVNNHVGEIGFLIHAHTNKDCASQIGASAVSIPK